MGTRNQVSIGLSYRPASLCSFATQFLTRFLESILRPTAGLKFQTQARLHSTQPGGISSLESILGLLKSLKFWLRLHWLAELIPWNRFWAPQKFKNSGCKMYLTQLFHSWDETTRDKLESLSFVTGWKPVSLSPHPTAGCSDLTD
jgi:hypothetical protein